MMRTAVFRLRGQCCGGPSGVFVQSYARMSAPSSPPPSRKDGVALSPASAGRMFVDAMELDEMICDSMNRESRENDYCV